MTGTRAPGAPLVHRMSPDERRRHVQQLVGRRVRLTVEPFRRDDELAEVLVGEIVSVARPLVGTVAEFVILRCPRRVDAAISLATVGTITDPPAAQLAGQTDLLDEIGPKREE